MGRRGIAIDRTTAVLLAVALAALGGWFVYRQATAPVSVADRGPRIDPSAEPVQEPADPDRAILVGLRGEKAMLEPQANYRVAARVCGTERYLTSWESDLAPIDLCLSWGVLATTDTSDFLRYSQSGRWYHFRLDNGSPLTVEEVSLHSANTHVIAATTNLRRAVSRIDEGDVVELEGALVNVTAKVRGRPVWWNSSLTRSDTGDGACEVFYVRSMRKDGRRYN